MPLILLNFQGKNCSALNSHLEFLLPQLPIVREILVLHVLILKQTREKLTGNFQTIWKIGKENLTGPGLEPETSGLPYQCSSIWAIQPLDGGPPE